MDNPILLLVGLLIFIGQLVYFFLAAGVANMSPVFVKNVVPILNAPIDGGVRFAGQPLFGDHKTWRGLVSAILVGGIFWLGQYGLTFLVPATRHWSPFDLQLAPWWFGFAFAAGAIFGDLVKSFFKRRMAILPGKSWIPFDQVDFLVGAAVVASFVYSISWQIWLLILVVGPLFHILGNYIGFWLKIKPTAW